MVRLIIFALQTHAYTHTYTELTFMDYTLGAPADTLTCTYVFKTFFLTRISYTHEWLQLMQILHSKYGNFKLAKVMVLHMYASKKLSN